MSRSRNLTTALAAMLLAVPSLQAVDLQSIPGTDTKLQVYGFVEVYGDYFANAYEGPSNMAASLFYKDGAYGQGKPGNQILSTYSEPTGNFAFDIAPTRFGFASVTPSASLGDISTKIEYDLNSSSSHLRLAQISVGGWTIGQQWSTWVDLDAGADTVDWVGPIGQASFDTPRFIGVSYQGKLDKNNTLKFALEQNSGYNDGTEFSSASTNYTNDSKIPTIIGAYTYSDDWGHLAVRALGQNVGIYVPAVPGVSNSTRFSKVEPAFQLSGDVKIVKDDLVFSVYNGSALGQYGTGFQASYIDVPTQTITAYKSTGWMIGYTHNWNDQVRSNLVAGGVVFQSDSALPATNGDSGPQIKSAASYEVNTIVKLAKTVDLGIEYMYEGAKSRVPGAAVDSNGGPASSIGASKVEVALTAHF